MTSRFEVLQAFVIVSGKFRERSVPSSGLSIFYIFTLSISGPEDN